MILNNDTTVEKNAISRMMAEVLEDGIDIISPKILHYYDHSKLNYAGGNLVPLKGGITIRGLGIIILDSVIFHKAVAFT